MRDQLTGRMTRRELGAAARARAAATAGAASAGALSATLLDTVDAHANAGTPRKADGEVLRLVLSLELVVALAYRHVLDSGLLTAHSKRVLAPLLTHEHEHINVIRAALRRLRTPAPPAPSSIEYAQSQLRARNGWGSFTDLHSEKDCLGLLTGAEAVAQGAYYEALGTLSHPAMLRTAAQILAAEAQHQTVIEALLHPDEIKKSVPSPYVEGIS